MRAASFVRASHKIRKLNAANRSRLWIHWILYIYHAGADSFHHEKIRHRARV